MKQLLVFLVLGCFVLEGALAASLGVEKLKELLKPVDPEDKKTDDLEAAEQFGFGFGGGHGGFGGGHGGYGGYGGYGGHGGYGGYGGHRHYGRGSSSSEEHFFG